MLRLSIKCPNHPRYNPERDGEAAIRGACRICTALFQLWKQARVITRDAWEASHTESEEDLV